MPNVKLDLPVVFFTGIRTGINKRRVLKSFDDEMENGKGRLRTNLGNKLTLYIDDIQQNIEGHFTRFDQYLAQEEEQIALAKEEVQFIDKRITELQKEIEVVLKSS